MAEFLKGNHLNSKLDEILEFAETDIILISPFIKFHSRVKDILSTKKNQDKLKITIVFGKNEGSLDKSFSREDFNFISEFPNVEIFYEPRLHAKYYGNEDASILSSMNLYEYSQNNNIEFGIFCETKLMDSILGSSTLDKEAWNYFQSVIEGSEVMFKREPVYESKMLGLSQKYVRSDIQIDKLVDVYEGKRSNRDEIPLEKEKIGFKSKSEKQQRTSGQVLSASKIAAKYGSQVSNRDVQNLMESNGYISGDSITSKGAKAGVVMKQFRGKEYIAYPEDMDILNSL